MGFGNGLSGGYRGNGGVESSYSAHGGVQSVGQWRNEQARLEQVRNDPMALEQYAGEYGYTPSESEVEDIVEYIYFLQNDPANRIMIDHSSAGLIHVAMNEGGKWYVPHTDLRYWDYLKLQEQIGDKKTLRGGVALGMSGGANFGPKGNASHEIDLEIVPNIGNAWLDLALKVAKWTGYGKKKKSPLVPTQQIQPVPHQIDSFVSKDPSFYLGNDSIRQRFQGYAIDRLDTSRFIMYPDSSTFPLNLRYDEAFPTKVKKIN